MLQEIVMARDDDVSVPLGDDWLALWVNFQRSLLGGWATQMGALGGWGACWRAVDRELWDQWAARFAGGVPIDG
ncbi:hypothetical protein [Xenophilus azovorans]|uniref:hypothetical protein n=2 Tax=Xenophilus TaxID=151754 RepID=UPI000571A3BC